MDNKAGGIKRITDKLYGGLNMSWLAVVLFAVGTAVLTAVFLILPVFKGTSFERMGVHLEAWIFFAVIIMANCKKPLESALKTFVFFLISQPLIYLIQVPFSALGWGLFRYYRYWFIWTLLTLPVAFVGWYINKRNWLSVLIFSPVLAFLGYTVFECGSQCLKSFPHLLVSALFCILQIALYVIAFFPDVKQKIVGILIPVIAMIVLAVIVPKVDITITEPLPGDPSFSEDAEVYVESSDFANIHMHSLKDGIVYIKANDYGTTTMTITDGGKEYRYTIEIYDDNGVVRSRITPLGQDGQ